ncbi:MAG: glycosyltransferase family 9 protein [Acidobacteriota bacterium]
MGQLLERLPKGSRVAVIRLRSLGDCVLTTPALALLKAHRPDLEIAVVVEDRFRDVFEGNPDIAKLLPPEPAVLRGFRPQLALNFHGGTRSMWLTTFSGATIKAGFAHHVYSFLYNQRIPRAQRTLGAERRVHTAEHLASAMFWMGVPRTEIPRAKLFAEPLATAPGGSYAVLHPFASAPDKAWPEQRFIEVARQLRQSGMEPVILAGPADNTALFSEFRVSGSLQEAKSLIAGAQLFLGNDSGPAHMAAAFGVPVVVLFGPSDPVTWAPWRTESQVLTAPAGMLEITVAQVNAAAELLRVKA